MYQPSWDYDIRTYIGIVAENEDVELTSRQEGNICAELRRLEEQGMLQSERHFWKVTREKVKKRAR